MNILIFGINGWIGQQLRELFLSLNHTIIPHNIRADDIENVRKLLEDTKPTHVISLIGRTHGGEYNTIDYLELPGKLRENLNDNLFSPLALGLLCQEKGIHYTYLGTGCIFNNDDMTTTFSEEDLPNFFGSSYSTVKGYTDRIMHLLPNVLNLRIRMPITNRDHPRNFITKICKYDKICSISNSMSVLPSLFPIIEDMMVKKRTGTINLSNPGVISHDEILMLYKKYVDNDFEWKNFTIEEQNQILLASRSNNHLCTEKLEKWYPDVKNIHDAVEDCMKNWIGLKYKRILITGGCGAIGSEVINYFKKTYPATKFINIDALTYCSKEENIELPYSNYELKKGNICNIDFIKDVLHSENIEAIIHLAAETHVDKSFGNSLEFTHTNITGTHNLLEAVKLYGKIKLFIHMSTDEVYGSVNDDELCYENSVFAPSNPYAASKAAAELLCSAYIKSFKLPIIIVRCNNAISKYQYEEKLIPKCINCIKKGEKIPIHGKGTSKRTFIHAIDIAKALEIIMKKGALENIYNISTDLEYSVLEVVQQILDIMKPGDKYEDWVMYVEDRQFQDYRYSIDSSKLRSLGWKDEINFKDALLDVIVAKTT